MGDHARVLEPAVRERFRGQSEGCTSGYSPRNLFEKSLELRVDRPDTKYMNTGDILTHVKNGKAVRTVKVLRVSPSVNRLGEPTGDVHAYVEYVSGKRPACKRYDVNVKDLV